MKNQDRFKKGGIVPGASEDPQIGNFLRAVKGALDEYAEKIKGRQDREYGASQENDIDWSKACDPIDVYKCKTEKYESLRDRMSNAQDDTQADLDACAEKIKDRADIADFIKESTDKIQAFPSFMAADIIKAIATALFESAQGKVSYHNRNISEWTDIAESMRNIIAANE